MTQLAHQKQISDQIEALNRVTENAIKSKETATQYLINAGIIEEAKDSSAENKPTSEKKK